MNPIETEYAAVTKKNSPRPTDWNSIIGNERAITQIREAITAAKKDGRPLPHLLLFAAPGSGKSTMAKVIARDMGGACVETTASTLEVPSDMIRFLWKLNDERERTKKPSTLFVDEIHMLGASKGRQAIDVESIYPLLEDWTFPHNLIGKKVQDMAGREWIPAKTSLDVWPFTFLGATTEPGMLSQALLRRFLLQIELEPYTEDEIARILIGASSRLGLVITTDAATTLSKYSRRNPGTGNSLIEYARARMSVTERTNIDNDVAREVVERLNLYSLGLNDTDVRVLKALYDRAPKGMGMAELSRAVGISQSQFSGLIEPYLRQLNFLETQARRVIRPEGVRYLASIGKVDIARPDVRAALQPA
jgi:Holliday junction DNA helicase RuvB